MDIGGWTTSRTSAGMPPSDPFSGSTSSWRRPVTTWCTSGPLPPPGGWRRLPGRRREQPMPSPSREVGGDSRSATRSCWPGCWRSSRAWPPRGGRAGSRAKTRAVRKARDSLDSWRVRPASESTASRGTCASRGRPRRDHLLGCVPDSPAEYVGLRAGVGRDTSAGSGSRPLRSRADGRHPVPAVLPPSCAPDRLASRIPPVRLGAVALGGGRRSRFRARCVALPAGPPARPAQRQLSECGGAGPVVAAADRSSRASGPVVGLGGQTIARCRVLRRISQPARGHRRPLCCSASHCSCFPPGRCGGSRRSGRRTTWLPC